MRPGKQGVQGAELLGDDQGRVVRQHDAARSDAHGPGATGHMGDHHARCRTRDADHVVVLGQPVAIVAPPFGVLRQIERVAQGIGGREAFGNGREIENGKGRHGHSFWCGSKPNEGCHEIIIQSPGCNP
jgi:hypothetical protein